LFSIEQSAEFEQFANPHSWFLVASELHEQATLLKKQTSGEISRYGAEGQIELAWEASNRSVLLLAGFALENTIKSFLIYERPQLIENGSLSRRLQSHKLSKLANHSNLIPYKNRGSKTLFYFEDGLESWARYPCGLNWAKTKEQNILDKKMWSNYLWLMSAYEKRLKKLFKKSWKGPHKFEGRYKITGRWLS